MQQIKMLYTVIFVFIIAANTDAQICLKKNKEDIIKITKMKGGIVKRNLGVDQYGFSSVTIQYPRKVEEKRGEYFSSFELKDNICFKSVHFYAGRASIQQEIATLDDRKSGYIRAGKGLFWTNKEKHFQIEIVEFLNRGKPTSHFSLEASFIKD